jgi:hypothetical protein
MSDLNFGDIVESNFVYTERALEERHLQFSQWDKLGWQTKAG